MNTGYSFDMKFCTECGTELSEKSKFCSECGTQKAPSLSDDAQSSDAADPAIIAAGIQSTIYELDAKELQALASLHPTDMHVYSCAICKAFWDLEEAWIGEIIAFSDNVTPELQIRILEETFNTQEGDLSKSIMWAIVSNQQTTAEVLQAVTKYDPFWLSEELLAHKNLSKKTRKEIKGWT
jgi:hypothetical protein